MKINKRIIVIIVSIISVLFILSNFSYAIDTGRYTDIYNASGTESINKVAGYILGIVQVIGMIVATVGAVVLAISYMVASPDGKAQIKDKAVIYITGLVIMFSASSLIGLIGQWAKEKIK